MCENGKATKIMMKLEDPQETLKIFQEHDGEYVEKARSLRFTQMLAGADYIGEPSHKNITNPTQNFSEAMKIAISVDFELSVLMGVIYLKVDNDKKNNLLEELEDFARSYSEIGYQNIILSDNLISFNSIFEKYNFSIGYSKEPKEIMDLIISKTKFQF
jgi:hypothetical protein